MDPAPRLFARHPRATGNRDAPVERDRSLVGDERAATGLPDAPRLVLPAGGEVVEELDVDPRGAKALEPAAIYDRVRVVRPDDHPRHSRRDDGVGAGRRAPVVRARLERHVEDGAARRVPGLLERDDLGVADALVLVPPLPDDLAVPHDHRADDWVVSGLAAATLGELERPLEVVHARSRTRLR